MPSATAQTTNDSPSVLLILEMIIPQVEHELPRDVHPQPTCKAGQLYSQHDVVGDPQSCFVNVVDAPSGVGAP